MKPKKKREMRKCSRCKEPIHPQQASIYCKPCRELIQKFGLRVGR